MRKRFAVSVQGKIQTSGHTEDNGVVFELGQSVVVQHATRGSVDIGIWVLGLAMLLQDIRSNLISLEIAL